MNKCTPYQDLALTAKCIYQDHLDRLSEAVLSGDIDALIAGHTMPVRIVTQTEDFVIETQADLAECATLFHKSIKGMGANNYIRLVSEAEFLTEDCIEGQHVTHTLKDAISLVPSYQNRMVLVRKDGIWRSSVVRSGLENASWPIASPKVDVTHHPRLSRHDPKRELAALNATPLSIYQSYLDALTATNISHDFEGWCALCDFPHSVHIDNFDDIISGPADVQPFFEMFAKLIADHKVDTVIRKADHAEFLSPTEICGYHQTTLSSKGEIKVGPVSSRYILHRTGTTWRMRSVTNSVANQQFPYDVPKISEALVSLRDIQKRNTRR